MGKFLFHAVVGLLLLSASVTMAGELIVPVAGLGNINAQLRFKSESAPRLEALAYVSEMGSSIAFEAKFAGPPTGIERQRVAQALEQFVRGLEQIRDDEKVEVDIVWTDVSAPNKRSSIQPVIVYFVGGRFKQAKGL